MVRRDIASLHSAFLCTPGLLLLVTLPGELSHWTALDDGTESGAPSFLPLKGYIIPLKGYIVPLKGLRVDIVYCFMFYIHVFGGRGVPGDIGGRGVSGGTGGQGRAG